MEGTGIDEVTATEGNANSISNTSTNMERYTIATSLTATITNTTITPATTVDPTKKEQDLEPGEEREENREISTPDNNNSNSTITYVTDTLNGRENEEASTHDNIGKKRNNMKNRKRNRSSNGSSGGGMQVPPPLEGGERGTLLKRLLSDQIDQEESLLLQAIKFIVKDIVHSN